MAARQQPRGTGLGVQYEDFVPKSDWKDQPEATLLTIDLQGFTKEQIKVMYVHASKMIRVTGERPLTGRRWSRFNEVFTVPENCLVDKLRGSFNNNVLTITMPKEKVEKLEEKRLLEESRRKEKEVEDEKKKKLLEEKEAILRKLQEEAKAKEMAEAKRLQEEAKEKEKAEARKLLLAAAVKEKAERRKLQEAAVAKKKAEERRLQEEAKAKEMAEVRRLQEEAKAKEMAEARKLQEAAIAKEKAEAKRLQEEAIAKEKAEARRLQEEAKAKERAEEKRLHEEAKAKAKEMAEARKLQEEAKAKEKLLEEAALEKKIQDKKLVMPEEGKLPEVDYTKSGPGSRTKHVSERTSEAVKSAEEKLSYLVVKGKKTGKGMMEKIRGREITSEEKKKMMVNVGVSALVIFALGAYVSYSFCSSSSSTKPE
ncbi:unnamed protein product [Eruca vesicaria subsp. sativa]|uniref:SHSP domain-containing protein n=1 Tax=Eruca vesicaria subsp. sativa TaxID=29727 RepID=A0ABC8LEU8_ERUVS|nr:unnamed protein product [Eruca vesicaria subsp. sativa]